jgi:hypothetical protein
MYLLFSAEPKKRRGDLQNTTVCRMGQWSTILCLYIVVCSFCFKKESSVHPILRSLKATFPPPPHTPHTPQNNSQHHDNISNIIHTYSMYPSSLWETNMSLHSINERYHDIQLPSLDWGHSLLYVPITVLYALVCLTVCFSVCFRLLLSWRLLIAARSQNVSVNRLQDKSKAE